MQRIGWSEQLNIREVETILRENYPTPHRLFGLPEKMYGSNEWCFRRLVANMIVGGSRDDNAVSATEVLFEQLGEEELKRGSNPERSRFITNLLERYDIKYPGKKAEHVLLTANRVRLWHDIVPYSLDALKALPGVGHHAASVMMALAFEDYNHFAVDLHVRRTIRRLGLTEFEGPDHYIEDLFLKEANEPGLLSRAFVDFGKDVCSVHPLCSMCPLESICPKNTIKDEV